MPDQWWDHLDELRNAPFWAVLISIFISAAPIIYGRWDKWLKRRDDNLTSEIDAEAKERAQLSADNLAIRDGLIQEVVQRRQETAESDARARLAEADRNRWSNIAWLWNSLAHRQRHDIANMVSFIRLICEKQGIPIPPQYATDLPALPGLEEIDGSKPRSQL